MFDLDTPEGRAAYIALCERQMVESQRQQAYAELELATRILTAQMEFEHRLVLDSALAQERFRRKQARDRAGKDTGFIYA